LSGNGSGLSKGQIQAMKAEERPLKQWIFL